MLRSGFFFGFLAMTRKLSPKQRLFVAEYLISLNATQAAIKAGYSEKTAFRIGAENMQKPAIIEEIQAAMKAREKRTLVTADYVISVIHETVERCRQAEPVRDQKGEQVMIPTPDGEMVPAYVFDAKNVLRGCELLGKHLGIFEKDNKQRNPADAVAAVISEIQANAKRGLPSEGK